MTTNICEDFPVENSWYSWPREFTQLRKFHKDAENETYLQWVQAGWDESGDEDEDETEDEDEDDPGNEGAATDVTQNEVEAVEDNSQSIMPRTSGEYKAYSSEHDSFESFPAFALSQSGLNKDNAPVDDIVDRTGGKDQDLNDVDNADIYNNVKLFMKGMIDDDKTLPYPDQVEKIAEFCEQARSSDNAQSPVALLQDENGGSTACAKGGRCRPYLGPLTAKKLREELQKKRFYDSKNVSSDQETDAERRMIFITNLDAPTIEALTATASRSQAPSLKDLFYKYLTNRASIGVDIPPRGYRVFSLYFYIPYYMLRDNLKSFQDSRKGFNGAPLRKSREFPFLSSFTNSSTSMHRSYSLYEAQASVAAVGIDYWVWNAYGIFDTCFDSEESVERYDQMNQTSWTEFLGRPDSLAAGQVSASVKFGRLETAS